MSLLINTHLHLAIDSLRRNRGRTFLSALGIAIGVASIVLILSLTGGIDNLISAKTEKDNANLVLVRPSNNKDATANIIDELTSSNQYVKSSLTIDDAKKISKIEGVKQVAPIAISNSMVQSGESQHGPFDVVATSIDLANIANLPLKNGQFLDNSLQENVAVLGYSAAMQIYGSPDALTRTFTYDGQRFLVVGVLDHTENPINYNGVNFDNSILINIDFAATFESSIQIQQIDVRTETTDGVSGVKDEITRALTESKGSDASFAVTSGDEVKHPAGSLLGIVSSMLTIVASISLIVGGVGIMNIMLVSVSERTREIGIRKSVGASAGHIMLQFLFESVILSIMGGVSGFALGYVFAFLISLVTPFAPHISWQILGITGSVSLVVGVLFGLYPAIKAARKDPIESIKFFR